MNSLTISMKRSPPVYEEHHMGKRARLGLPKIRKPTPSYLNLRNFNADFDQMESSYRYERLRNRWDGGRGRCYQHEPFKIGYQPQPRLIYHEIYNDRRRVLPTFQIHQHSSEMQNMAVESPGKTRIFNPNLEPEIRYNRSGKMQGTGYIDNLNNVGYEIPWFQNDFSNRKSMFVNACEAQSWVRNKRENVKKTRKIDSNHEKVNDTKTSLCCKKDHDKRDTLPASCKEDSGAEERQDTPKREGDSKVSYKEEVIGKEEKKENDKKSKLLPENENKKPRRKAFTAASTLMEKIIEKPEEMIASGNLKENKNESKTEKCKEAKHGESFACKVFGLLSLQGSRERRYEITVEELRRRVNAPEHLNKVDMISYLRLAKNSARLLLEKYDIISSLHHRLSKHTILSKVSEKECEDLAIGIHDINMSCFPFTVLAEDSISKLKETGVKCDQEKELLKKRYQDLETARSVLMAMSNTMMSMQSTKELDDFKKITHTFGIQNLSNHIAFFDKYLTEEEQLILDDLKND